MTEELSLNVRRTNGSTFTVSVPACGTVDTLMAAIAANSDVPVELQRLVYHGKILKSTDTLKEHGTSLLRMHSYTPSTAPLVADSRVRLHKPHRARSFESCSRGRQPEPSVRLPCLSAVDVQRFWHLAM